MITAPRAAAIAIVTAAAAAQLGHAPPARADQSATKVSCTLRGMAQMPVNLAIYDKPSGGSPIARFSGGETALAASDFFADGGKRVEIQTGTGTGSFRIAGYIDASKVPVFTKHRVSVISGNVWIAPNRSVSVLGGRGGKLKIQKKIDTPLNQTFSTWASCSSLTLDDNTPPGWTVPGHARGYVLKKDSAELFDGVGSDRSSVTTLYRAAGGTGVLFWSQERKGAFVNIEYHGDVEIRGWVRSRDLKALPRGETMDVQHGPVSKRKPPQLALAQKPDLVKTEKEIPIRIGAGEDKPVIGRIEADTETYVLDTVAGWASVLPKSLNVAPYGDNQFWVKASDLPKP
ncbi:MAG: hypothetical protein KC776_25870 [Myxococcales bacterium]|nr:hypothetical protein [Myxococcales bacterium]MCB9582585.1 hypothetical protein [Polyangiaceae bacterium]